MEITQEHLYLIYFCVNILMDMVKDKNPQQRFTNTKATCYRHLQSLFSSLSVYFNKPCNYLLSFKGASTIFIFAIYQFNKSDVFCFTELLSKSYMVSKSFCELMLYRPRVYSRTWAARMWLSWWDLLGFWVLEVPVFSYRDMK